MSTVQNISLLDFFPPEEVVLAFCLLAYVYSTYPLSLLLLLMILLLITFGYSTLNVPPVQLMVSFILNYVFIIANIVLILHV